VYVCISRGYFFLNGKYIINQISVEDEQRPVKKKMYKRSVVYKQNTENNHENKYVQTLWKTPTQSKKLPLLNETQKQNIRLYILKYLRQTP
jgi:hypothetical protein